MKLHSQLLGATTRCIVRTLDVQDSRVHNNVIAVEKTQLMSASRSPYRIDRADRLFLVGTPHPSSNENRRSICLIEQVNPRSDPLKLAGAIAQGEYPVCGENRQPFHNVGYHLQVLEWPLRLGDGSFIQRITTHICWEKLAMKVWIHGGPTCISPERGGYTPLHGGLSY